MRLLPQSRHLGPCRGHCHGHGGAGGKNSPVPALFRGGGGRHRLRRGAFAPGGVRNPAVCPPEAGGRPHRAGHLRRRGPEKSPRPAGSHRPGAPGPEIPHGGGLPPALPGEPGADRGLRRPGGGKAGAPVGAARGGAGPQRHPGGHGRGKILGPAPAHPGEDRVAALSQPVPGEVPAAGRPIPPGKHPAHGPGEAGPPRRRPWINRKKQESLPFGGLSVLFGTF